MPFEQVKAVVADDVQKPAGEVGFACRTFLIPAGKRVRVLLEVEGEPAPRECTDWWTAQAKVGANPVVKAGMFFDNRCTQSKLTPDIVAIEEPL